MGQRKKSWFLIKMCSVQLTQGVANTAGGRKKKKNQLAMITATRKANEVCFESLFFLSRLLSRVLEQWLLIVRCWLLLRRRRLLGWSRSLRGRIGHRRHGGVVIGRHVHDHARLVRVVGADGLVHVLRVHAGAEDERPTLSEEESIFNFQFQTPDILTFFQRLCPVTSQKRKSNLRYFFFACSIYFLERMCQCTRF